MSKKAKEFKSEFQDRRAHDGPIIGKPAPHNSKMAWASVTTSNFSPPQNAVCTGGQSSGQLYICRHSGQSRTLIIPITQDGMPIGTNNGNSLTNCEILTDPNMKAEWTKLTVPFDPDCNSYNAVNASRSSNDPRIYIGKITDGNGYRGLGTIIYDEGGREWKLLCGTEPHELNKGPVNGLSYHVLCQK